MKRILIMLAAILTITVSIARAGEKYIPAWHSLDNMSSYLELKSEADNATITADSVIFLIKASKIALVEAMQNSSNAVSVSKLMTIAEWQMNDAGYALIQEFKKNTNYLSLMKNLEAKNPSKEKIKMIADTKQIMINELPLLDEAEKYITGAKNLSRIEPMKKINSNLDFIKWVKVFIKEK